jgi:hypothetical protein
MEENITEQKKWSWLGLLFGPYYYAGYGKFKKAVLLGFLSLIPIVGYIGVPIYCGLKAKQELPIGERQFSWGSVFGLFGVYAILVFLLLAIAAIVETQKNDKNETWKNQTNSVLSTSNEFTIPSIKIGQPLSQFDGILKCELSETPALASKSGKTVVAQCTVNESKAIHWNDFIGRPQKIYLDQSGNVCGFSISFDIRLSSKDLAYMSKDIFGEELPYSKVRSWNGEELDSFEQTKNNGVFEEQKKLFSTVKT